MIKFEVGKSYKRLDYEHDAGEVVVSRSDDAIRTLMLWGYPDFETKHNSVWRISVIDDIEKITAGDITLLSADKPYCGETEEDEKLEAFEKGIKELDKEEEKKEELQKDSDDWIEGKEYEAILFKAKQRFKAVFVGDDGDERYNFPLRFKLPFKDRGSDIFNDLGNIAEGHYGTDKIIILKHGIKSILDWEEIKEEPREPVHFRVGNTYKGFNDEMFVCQTTFITTNSEKVGVFYNSKKDAILAQKIYSKNNVEYTYFMKTDQLDFIADEKYRDEIQGLL